MLSTSIVTTAELIGTERDTMFALYDFYYEGGDPSVFKRDLDGKDYVVVMRDPENTIRGFSTLAVYSETRNNAQVRVIYSGDTIIDKMYWGQNQFSRAWISFAGGVKAQHPELPLYWLLIVKGHRTYRYLSLFSNNYFPRHDRETPSDIQELMHYLAKRRFGQAYDESSGLIRFSEPRSFLSPEIAQIPSKDCHRPEVKYFLQRNPQYYEGDELLCLCELKAENLTKLARSWFEQECMPRQ